MEPKDLKNSEELEIAKITNPETSGDDFVNEVDVTPEMVKNVIVTEEIDVTEVVETSFDGLSEATVEIPEEIPVVEEIQNPDEDVSVPEQEDPAPELPEESLSEETFAVTRAERIESKIRLDEQAEIQVVAVVDNEGQENHGMPAKGKRPRIEKVDTPIIELPKKERIDYSQYTEIDLVNALRDVIDNHEEYELKDEVEAIKSAFYKQLNEKQIEKKRVFVEGGGDPDQFVAEHNPYEEDIKALLEQYRHLRTEFNKQLEAEKEENLKLKYQIIEDIKLLLNNEESINKTFAEFRDLQKKWREIGLVPQSKMKDLWENYHFHVENFYDFIKINKELRDLDLRKNLELKIEICERAEELIVEPSVLKAFNNLQKLHEQWREIGPVPNEHKDDIWERFKAATAKINKKHQDYFEERKTEQKDNLDAKIALCEKAEQLTQSENNSNKEWDELSKELVQLQEVWRTIGFAPKKENNKVYERFRAACDKFFDAKRDFYSKSKDSQNTNLQMKIELCLEAETLKESTDWKKTTQDFINIQKRWKEIGPVPRKHSDLIWKRFRAACDHFFEKKSSHFSGIDNEQSDNLRLKEELIDEVVNFKTTGDVNEDLNILKNYQRRWTEIGHVPIKRKDEIQNRFRDAINKLYDSLKMESDNHRMFNFRSKMSNFSESSRGQGKMRAEREKYMMKLKQLESDIILLDNNVGFFAKSKNAESLILEVNKKIESTKKNIEELKEKIRVIDDIDKSE